MKYEIDNCWKCKNPVSVCSCHSVDGSAFMSKDEKQPEDSGFASNDLLSSVSTQETTPDEIKRLAGMFGISTKLAGYYVSLFESLDDMISEAQAVCQREQSDEPFYYVLIRRMEEHRKSCRINLP